MEGPVPIDHKKYHQAERKVHRKKYYSAISVFSVFHKHFFACGMLSRVAHQKKAHQCKGKIVSRQGIEPKAFVCYSHSKLQNCIGDVKQKRSEQREIDAKARIRSPSFQKSIFANQLFDPLYQIWKSHTPHGQRIERQNVGRYRDR